jgi:hypothetical protein
MGTTYVTVERGAGRDQIGTIEWTLAAGFQPADGVTRGTIRISTGNGNNLSNGLDVASSRAVVGDLYRAILLREPDAGAQDFITMVDREGVDGIFRAASRIALSTESRTTVAQKGKTAEQRLAALFQHLQGRNRRAITVAEWERYRAQLDRGEIESVALDLLWSDAFFSRHRLDRPATRPLGDSLAARDARFRGQDRDADGRITRAEWSGNDVSFANHDWNDDGVLSGVEIQASGAAGTAGERFTALDRDRDALLQRDEWPGRGDDFSRLDRNGDGAVSRREFENPDVPVLSREDRFRAIDLNGDSVLIADEMRGAAELFAQLDANHDNRVVLAEYLNPPVSLTRLQLFMRWDHDDSGYLARRVARRHRLLQRPRRRPRRAGEPGRVPAGLEGNAPRAHRGRPLGRRGCRGFAGRDECGCRGAARGEAPRGSGWRWAP